MWPRVKSELADLLSRKVFSALRDVPEYEKLLVSGVPDRVACAAAADEIVSAVQKSGGVKEFGSRQAPAAKEWSGELFRAASPRNNPYGAWWFDPELVRRWEQVYPACLPRFDRRQKIYDSLRPMLAVCYDWNGFTQLWVMRLPGNIPVITGQGASQPIFSQAAGQKHLHNKNVAYIGGYQQIYIPFVPKDRVVQYLI